MLDYSDDSDTWLGSAHRHAELAAHQIARFRNPCWNPTWHDLIPDDSPPPSLAVSFCWGLRGKRSRPATVRTGGGVAPKRDACSPATPLDFGSGFGSGASTSGGEEVTETAMTSAKRERRRGDGDVSGGCETEAVRNGSPPSDFRISAAKDIQRTRKKKTLGELQEEEKLLLEEKNMLQKEKEMGRKAYGALKVENQRLKHQQKHMQSEEASVEAIKCNASQKSDTHFILPDLNEPLSDDFD